MKSNTELNVLRSVIHISGLSIILIRIFLGSTLTLCLIAIVSLLYSLSEIIRLRMKKFFLVKLTLLASREEEKDRFIVKPLYYAVGIVGSILLFPKNIGDTSIILLTLGDGLAHIFGILFGKTRNPLNKSKTIEGTLLGFTTAFLVSILIIHFEIAFIGAVIGAVIESFGKPIDDNISVPLLSGLAMILVTIYIPFF
jgi:dolichol kinase